MRVGREGVLPWERLHEQWNGSRKWVGLARERLGDAYSWEWKECLVDFKMVGYRLFILWFSCQATEWYYARGICFVCVPPTVVVQPLMYCSPHAWPKPGEQVYEMEHKNRCYALLSIPYWYTIIYLIIELFLLYSKDFKGRFINAILPPIQQILSTCCVPHSVLDIGVRVRKTLNSRSSQ